MYARYGYGDVSRRPASRNGCRAGRGRRLFSARTTGAFGLYNYQHGDGMALVQLGTQGCESARGGARSLALDDFMIRRRRGSWCQWCAPRHAGSRIRGCTSTTNMTLLPITIRSRAETRVSNSSIAGWATPRLVPPPSTCPSPGARGATWYPLVAAELSANDTRLW